MAANVRFNNPKTLAKPPGYTYVVEATGPNRLIFIAGQLGLGLTDAHFATSIPMATPSSLTSTISSRRVGRFLPT